ncbi:FAD binding domain-containing protein [Streptomyces sp. NPDC001843]|uniref:FAD binding domain-containing protein n=1 Tax=Streptomyces sp. NPDC001843 TaxID=3364617 RepID=UPI00367D61D1
MLLRLPRSVSEAQECLVEGAVPVGGATLVWATWLRDGFPEQALSLHDLPEANVVGREELGAAVVLHQVGDPAPEVLRRAAASVGTGAVRRAATVGGNLVGSTLRCLLPPALVLDARCTVLGPHGRYETDLSEVPAKRPLLLGLRWREPLVSGYRKLSGDAGGAPPLVVAAAVHAEDGGQHRLRVAARDGDEVLSGGTECVDGTEDVLGELWRTDVGALGAAARDVVREEVTGLLARLAGR